MRSRFRPISMASAVVALLTVVATVGLVNPNSAEAYYTDEFIAQSAAPARASQQTYGVPASVIIAQAILETGWGRSTLAIEAKNYFGIKCKTVVSPYQIGCYEISSAEYINGVLVYQVSGFRQYATMTDSFKDHGLFLSSSSRYAGAFQYKNQPDDFIRAVAAAGYATDPSYADLIISLMTRYNLYAYNVAPAPSPTPTPTPTIAKTATPSPVYALPASATTPVGTFTTTISSTSSAAKIKALQYLLISRGQNITADGRFGPKTTEALKAFQASAGITVSGVATPETLSRLTSLVRYGQNGYSVAALNTLLSAKGYKTSGGSSYRTLTQRAVKAFQSSSKLTVDSIVGPMTWGYLFR